MVKRGVKLPRQELLYGRDRKDLPGNTNCLCQGWTTALLFRYQTFVVPELVAVIVILGREVGRKGVTSGMQLKDLTFQEPEQQHSG